MCKWLSFLSYESAQDVKFLGSQVDSLSTHFHVPFLEIDAQFWSLNFGERLCRSGASQCSSNARQQFSDCERFYHVIVRPGIQGKNLVLLRISDRDHDDGCAEAQSQLATSLQPAHFRHVYV